MSEWTLKRFWTKAEAAQTDTGWTITLDGRAVRTPAKAVLGLPSRALAEAVALEWDAQQEVVNPNEMPLTRLSNSAQDKVAVQHADVAALVAEYGGSDLLCYRADGPEALTERQAVEWDPLLDWARAHEGIALAVQTGIMPTPQPETSLARVHQITAGLSAPELTGFHDLVALSGSWVIGYAALRDARSLDALWAAAHLDEIWQAEQWGDDDEALALRATKRAAFGDAKRFVDLANAL